MCHSTALTRNRSTFSYTIYGVDVQPSRESVVDLCFELSSNLCPRIYLNAICSKALTTLDLIKRERFNSEQFHFPASEKVL